MCIRTLSVPSEFARLRLSTEDITTIHWKFVHISCTAMQIKVHRSAKWFVIMRKPAVIELTSVN